MEIKNRASNYEKMKDQMAEVFLQYDQEKMIQKFELEHDKSYLYLYFIGRKYRIHRLTGAAAWSKDSFQTEEKADYNEAMTIYDVLCYSKEDCRLSHEWVNIDSCSSVQGGSLTKGNQFFGHAAEAFDGKEMAFAAACEKLGGRKINKGDAAYDIDMFPFLPVSLRYWASDEEFPASLQILVDKNILDYMHYETLMFAITHLLYRLRSECEEYEKTKAAL